MGNINNIKREIAEMALSGLNAQDMLRELQDIDWDMWIEEAMQRKMDSSVPAKIIACATCQRNFEAKEGEIANSSLCSKCKNEYNNSRSVLCKYCRKTYLYKDGVDHRCCSEACKENRKIVCLACEVRFLPISETGLISRMPASLCETCFTPEMVKERDRVVAHNTRAIELGLDATLTLPQWIATLKYFDRKCAYCLVPFKHLEHFLPLELGGGTTVNNCVPSCQRCNARKNIRNQEELYKYFPSANLARIREYLASVA